SDPHLDAQIPSLWYLAHLSAGDFDVIGATLPGAPAIVIGRNRYIAWGVTNVMADVQDLYPEPADEPLRTVNETIAIKGTAPLAFDPPEHFIVSANNKITPDSYPYAIEGEWIDPYRAERIVERLKEKPKLTPDDFASIQADTYSLHAKAMLPILLARVHPIDAADVQAVAILRQWN